MKFITKTKIFSALALIFAIPSLANAAVGWQPLVVCGYDNNPCKWTHIILFANNFINDLILLALPVAAIAFAWAGFLILTSGGDESKMKTGKSVLIKVAIGFAWIIGAFVLISFIMKTFVTLPSAFNLLQQ